MQVTILGAGNMGAALAKQLTRAGHHVRLTARNLDKAGALAASIPGTTVAAPAQALADSETLILATGYADAIPALRSLGTWRGKIIIDITNPLTADYMGLTVGFNSSAAEEVAKAVPEADVVKAFNTLFAQVVAQGPAFIGPQIAPVFYASDAERAKQTARVLIESIGFKAVDAGGLKNARYLEPLGGLNVYFGYGAGHGTSIAPTWIHRS